MRVVGRTSLPFIMLSTITGDLHSKVLTTLLILSPRGCSPMGHTIAEAYVPSLTEVVQVLGKSLQMLCK